MLPVLKSRIVPTVTRFLDDDWGSLFEWPNQGFPTNAMTVPSTNVRENENSFIVELAAPGMRKDDFQIVIDNNVLKIKSESKTENEASEKENYTRREFSYQSFERSFTLNSKVVEDTKINATYEDGILRLIIPKKEEAKVKPARQILIK